MVAYKGEGIYEVILEEFITLMVEVLPGKEELARTLEKSLPEAKESVLGDFAANQAANLMKAAIA